MSDRNGGTYVRDLRHRFSLELRPDSGSDRQLRSIAHELERAGLLAAGSATQPRFQPHVTFFRAAKVPLAAAAIGSRVTPQLELGEVITFGHGRIVAVAPLADTQLAELRSEAIEAIRAEQLDPLASSRPWIPHVTLAYEVAEPHQAAALDLVRGCVPLTVTWGSCEIWDLDIRPTRRVASMPI